MNELELVAAKAAIQPVMRTLGGLLLNRQGRELQAKIREKYGQATLAALDLEINRSIAERGMAHTADLIDLAMTHAGGNDFKFQQLLPIALRYGRIVGEVLGRQSLHNPY